MRYEVYCDESCIESFFDKKAHQYALIGSVWIPAEYRKEAKQKIEEIRHKYSLLGEMKWNKVNASTMEMYKELVRFFFSSKDIQFRVICIKALNINHDTFNNGKGEIGFYKFYFQLLYHWLKNDCEYNIFLDYKVNGYAHRVAELKHILQKVSNATIGQVQAINSKQSNLIQLADVLTGAVACVFNEQKNSKKIALCEQIESLLGHSLTQTPIYEKKFNVFNIGLREW